MIWTLHVITIFMASNVLTLSVTYHIDQNLALNNEYILTKPSNIHQISKVDVPEPIENYKNKSTEKLHDVEEEGLKQLRTRSQAVRMQSSGILKSIGSSAENHHVLSNQHIYGTRIENSTTGGSSNHQKINENKGFSKLNPKLKVTASGHEIPETSAGVETFPHQNDNFNQKKTDQFSFLDYFTKRKQPTILINSSRDDITKIDLIRTKGVFPEEKSFLDVLTSVQREGFNGFPKGKNQLFNTNIKSQTTTEVYRWNEENHFTSEKFPESHLMFVEEIKEAQVQASQERLKKSNVNKTNSVLNLPMPERKIKNDDIELQSTTIEKVYVQNGDNSYEKSTESSMILVDDTVEAEVPATQEHGKSNHVTETFMSSKKLQSEYKELKRLTNKNKEDEIQVQNAMYKFSTSQNDGISDLLHERTETRQDGKVTGSYSYSDGFLLRKVNYVADENGYRIISEVTIPLPGNGPKVNPQGIADIRTDVGGYPLHYIVHGRELPMRTSYHQDNDKIMERDF